ncbi:cytosolic 5-nucleotidase iii-like, partial [Lynx pardinus]
TVLDRDSRSQLIHTYNKNSSICKNSRYFQQLLDKTNILLLEDFMEDLTMADKVTSVESIHSQDWFLT